MIANLGSSSACSFRTTYSTTENKHKVKENSIMSIELLYILYMMCVCKLVTVLSFCFLPSCLPAELVGSLLPLEHISYFQGVTPASPPAS